MELEGRSDQDILTHVAIAVSQRLYRVRLHAQQHMVAEGFDESNLVTAITGKTTVVERYEEDSRCLILGYFEFANSARSPLHVVCDLANDAIVDVVTAYIPVRPWWNSPRERG